MQTYTISSIMSAPLLAILLYCTVILLNKTKSRRPLWHVILIAAVIRFAAVILYIGINNYDIISYKIIGETSAQGISVYPSLAYFHHPYFPFLVYLEWLTFILTRFGISQMLMLKLIFCAFDVGVTWMIYRLGKSHAALLYSINPLSVLIIASHGQFDSIPLFFLLLALFYIRLNSVVSVLWYSLAIGTKTWPIIFIIPFIASLKQKKTAILIASIPIILIGIYFYLFRPPIFEIIRPVLTYRGIYGYWSITALFSYIIHRNDILEYIFKPISNFTLIMFFLYSLSIKSKNIPQVFTQLIVVFYATSMTIAEQWLLWIMPFLVITRPKFWLIYLFLATLMSSITQLTFVECSLCPLNSTMSSAIKIVGIFLWIITIIMSIEGNSRLNQKAKKPIFSEQ